MPSPRKAREDAQKHALRARMNLAFADDLPMPPLVDDRVHFLDGRNIFALTL